MDYVFYFASLSQINPPCTRGQKLHPEDAGKEWSRDICTNSLHELGASVQHVQC